jgi:hypothetical protein
MEWLRNAWGNVDEFGRHVYDVMQRVRHVFVPYNKLTNLQQGDSAGSGVGKRIVLIAQWKDLQQLYCPLKARMRRQQKMFDLSDYRSMELSSICS